MLKPDPTGRFKKDFKKYEYNKPVKKELETVMGFLLEEKKLPEKYLDHTLTGNYTPLSSRIGISALRKPRDSTIKNAPILQY